MIVEFPAIGIAQIDWDFDQPANVNRSTYTKKRSVAVDPWHGLVTGRVTVSSIVGEKRLWALRAFLAGCKGQTGSFRLPATEGGQKHLPAATVAADAAAGASTITLTGALMTAGMLATVNDQLLFITSTDGFDITFTPRLREGADAGTTVEVGNPTVLAALASSKVSWSAGKGQTYSCSFDIEEAF